MSTTASITSLQRISAKNLSSLILQAESKGPDFLAIIDVRDDDYIGGHIRGSRHFPSRSIDAKMPILVRELEKAKTVVFHCALSQQRGPSAALRYLRSTADRYARKMPQTSTTTSPDGTVEETDGNVNVSSPSSFEPQAVYVLDGGFNGWQRVYGEDDRLTTNYVPELWRESYWG